MTKHSMVTMRLHRSGVILVAVLALLFAILIFAVGYIAGMSRGMKLALQKPEGPKIATPKIATPKIATPKLPVAKLPAMPAATTTAAPAATTTEAAAAPRMLAIRAGVFPAEEEAKALVQRLAAEKLEATITPVVTDAGPTLYIVLTGRFASRREAAAAAAELERKMDINTAVVPLS